MDSTFAFVVFIVVVALIFDFINGFHDAANSIATVVATRVLSPFHAVLWAAFFNFIAAFTLGTAVAKTMGKGLVNLEIVTPHVILAGLVGAIVWDLVTWHWGLPSSSSHALIGGYIGAAMAKVVLVSGFTAILTALDPKGWSTWNSQGPLTLIFILVAPFLGLVLAWTLMIAVHWSFRNASPKRMDNLFRKGQLLSSALFSFSHGSNDAQKTMGIITGVLYAGKVIENFEVPTWVVFAAHGAIGLGTLSGGWKIVKTMGARLTRLKPRGGFCAEAAAAISILFSTELGMPVSTTHTIAGAIAGVGSIQRAKAVRWGLAGNIVWAWVLTIPAAGLVGGLTMLLVWLFSPAI